MHIDEVFTFISQLQCLISAYDTFQSGQSTYAPFFVIIERGDQVEVKNFSELDNAVSGTEDVRFYYFISYKSLLIFYKSILIKNESCLSVSLSVCVCYRFSASTEHPRVIRFWL